MDDECKFTVLVTAYNPQKNDLRRTLDSVINQKMDNYEIVVADDGSSDCPERWLKEYFKEKGFVNYRLVMNHKNSGTVQNVLSGLKVAQGKYVRPLGQGDALSNPDVLRRVYEFMDERACNMCFGLVQGFIKTENGYRKKYFACPRDIQSYRKRNTAKIQRNVIYYSDHVSGIAFFIEKGTFEYYLRRLEKDVKYEEDLLQVEAALNGEYLELFDEVCVYYEMGVGVSDAKSKFYPLLQEDVRRFYNRIYDEYRDNPNVKKRKRLEKTKKIGNIYLRTLARLFYDPYTIVYLINYYWQKMTGKHLHR